jgi:serine/threonine protein kinase
MHGCLENAWRMHDNVLIHAFKSVESTLWSLIPETAQYVAEGYFTFGPLKVPVTAARVRLIATCDCCVYVGDFQLQVSGRSEFREFLRSQGALFEDRELVASLEQRGSCLVGRLNREVVAIARRKTIDRFIRELDIFRSVHKQPSTLIVTFIGAFIDRDGTFLLATKYSSYGDLYGALTRQKFSLPHAIRIFTQILEGIKVLHELGFVWRDCKPENTLVCDAATESIVLADFSLACREEDPDLQVTRCGTLGYTAPEILLIPFGGTISRMCDMWSAGSVLFDLLVGKSLVYFETNEDSMRSMNINIRCVWKGHGKVSFYSGERKFKIDFGSDLLAELVSGLLEADPGSRISVEHALEICSRI